METADPDRPRAHRRGRARRRGRRLHDPAAGRLDRHLEDDDVTVLQKGAALLVIGGVPTLDPPELLATWYRDAWFADGGYTGGEPVDREVGDGIPAAELDYTGVFQGTQVDGRIVAGVVGRLRARS